MKRTLITGAAVVATAGIIAAGAIAGSTPQTMPAKDPTVSDQASIQKAVPGKRLGGTKRLLEPAEAKHAQKHSGRTKRNHAAR